MSSTTVEANSPYEEPPKSFHTGHERVEAQRSRVASAVRPERADPAGQPDQRRVAGGHVAYPDLGLRHVEQRVPVRTAQRDQRHDEREREHRDQHPQEQRIRRAGGPSVGGSARVDGMLDGYVVDHGSAFNARSSPGRTGD